MSIDEGSTAETAPEDAQGDDHDQLSITTILDRIRARSEAEKPAFGDASGDRENPALPGPFARSSFRAEF